MSFTHKHTWPTSAKKEYKEYKEIYNKTSDFLFRVCPLFKALYERELPHNYKFLLATNLVHVKGGKTMFFSGIIENQEKWEVHWKYIKNYYNHPQSCENGECPYATQCRCKSLYEKLTRSIIRIESEEKYISLEEASYMMKREIASSIDRKGDMITLIRAQTSLGKTTAYCSMAKDWNKEKKLLIVVPTIKLQEQVQDDLRKVGVYAYKTENIRKLLEELELIDLLEQVENLYNKGFGGRVKRIIKEYIKSNPEIDKVKLMRLERYLETNERLNGKNHVVTTHAMFLALPEIILKQYEIIVDEDILMTIFKGTSSISFEELEIAKQAGILPIYVQQNLNRILAMQNGSLGKIKLIEDMQEMEETVYEADLPIGSSLLDFLMSDTYYVDANEKIIHYYKAKKLPNVKMTIVSASVNKKLYQDYASNRRIRFIDIPQVKYCGKLIQYTQHSMSRSFIHETGRERIMDSIATITGEETKIISFKMINEDADIYFGKTEGFNDYKGVNLAVVGTPHSIPFVYQLIGKYLGYSSEEGMNVRYAEHNGYGFSIMTFEDEAMRNLQFHFLESELEQAIGRARLLRFPCTVYLFSNYPCRQAEIIQDEYLIAENE